MISCFLVVTQVAKPLLDALNVIKKVGRKNDDQAAMGELFGELIE